MTSILSFATRPSFLGLERSNADAAICITPAESENSCRSTWSRGILPGITPEQLAAAAGRAKSVTADMTQLGKPVRYLRSTFLPAEEKAFCLFEAPSPDRVREAN